MSKSTRFNTLPSSGQRQPRPKSVESILDEVKLNAHYMCYPDNETDPIGSKINRDQIEQLSKTELEPICKRVRAELERFDEVVTAGVGMYSGTDRPWGVNRNPDCP